MVMIQSETEMPQAYILKAGFAGSQKPQIILNFPQKDCLRTRKTVNSSMCVRNKTKLITKHYQLLPIITNFYQLLPIIIKIIDLLTVVAEFYCRFLRTFSADFLRLKSRLRRFFHF